MTRYQLLHPSVGQKLQKPEIHGLVIEYRMLADSDGDHGGYRSDGQLRPDR